MAGKSKASYGALHLSNKVMLIVAVCGLISLYFLYSWLTAERTQVHAPLKRFTTWKTVEFIDIPADVLEKSKDMKIEERTLSFEFSGKNIEVFFLEVTARKSDAAPVLLLHGAASSSEVWRTLGTIKLLGAMGSRVVAVDLPGYGSAVSKNAHVGNDHSASFLEAFIKQEKLDRPVIVSPSMSGKFSLPYIMEPSPASCLERARAFVPLAPVLSEMYSDAQYHRCEMPVLIVYGTKDKSLGLFSTGNLRNMPNREIFPMEGAHHANYQERPEEWHRLLYNFMLAVNREHNTG